MRVARISVVPTVPVWRHVLEAGDAAHLSTMRGGLGAEEWILDTAHLSDALVELMGTRRRTGSSVYCVE